MIPVLKGFLLRGLAVLAVLAFAFACYEGVARPWIRHWGTQDDEVTRTLPGDDVIHPATHQETRAISIDASASVVWAWVAQLGQDRGGFYSFTDLENFFGSQMPDVRILDAKLQHWDIGDRLWMMTPEKKAGAGAFMTLRDLEPGRYLAFEGQSPFGEGHGSWTLVVVPQGPHQARLLTRDRAGTASSLETVLSREVFEPMHFVMSRRMFSNIKALAEGQPISTLSNDIHVALWILTGILGLAAAIVALRPRKPRLGLVVLLACTMLFQVLTFVQPPPLLGAILVVALFVALVSPFRDQIPIWRRGSNRPAIVPPALSK